MSLSKKNPGYRRFENDKDNAICCTKLFHCIFSEVPGVLGRLYEYVRWRRSRKVALHEMAVSPFTDFTGCPPVYPLSRRGKKRLSTLYHQCYWFDSSALLAHFLSHGKAAPVTGHDSDNSRIPAECKFYKIK